MTRNQTAPHMRPAVVLSSHSVVVRLTDAEPMVGHGGGTFDPQTLTVTWQDGALSVCSLRGPRLTQRGRPARSAEGMAWSFMQVARPGELDPGTPHWVRAVVRQHQPELPAVAG